MAAIVVTAVLAKLNNQGNDKMRNNMQNQHTFLINRITSSRSCGHALLWS